MLSITKVETNLSDIYKKRCISSFFQEKMQRLVCICSRIQNAKMQLCLGIREIATENSSSVNQFRYSHTSDSFYMSLLFYHAHCIQILFNLYSNSIVKISIKCRGYVQKRSKNRILLIFEK